MQQPNGNDSFESEKVELINYGIVTNAHIEADKVFASRHGRLNWSAVERPLSADSANRKVVVPIVTHCNKLKPAKHVSLTRRLSQQVDQPLEIVNCNVKQLQVKSVGKRLTQKLFSLSKTTHHEKEELLIKKMSFRQWLSRNRFFKTA
ncbi:hypothetical protein SARC_04450, partial [Sphaeroforma arctica JP610]